MKDPRIAKMAKTIVEYFVKVKPGENVLIDTSGTDFSITKELIQAVYAAGAKPFIETRNPEVEALQLKSMSEEQMKLEAEFALAKMKKMDVYIGVRGTANIHSGNIIPPDQGEKHRHLYQYPVQMVERVENTRWVVLRVPGDAMAQNSGMSTEEFEEFYFNVCAFDYERLHECAKPLLKMMAQTDKVRITGRNTDLSFSIKGQPIPDIEHFISNLPEGEVFVGPLKYSANGYITYNLPSKANSTEPEEIFLRFEKGKIVEIKGRNQKDLERTFNTDEGARYLGEFAIGIHPKITKPIMETLFDEKMTGSLHVTPGNCYKSSDNGNYSAIHMDMIMIQTPDFGGGDIWFDDTLIRRDGLFVPEELQGLNPEHWL